MNRNKGAPKKENTFKRCFSRGRNPESKILSIGNVA